jgi:low temperature requirement protein LtrA
VQVLWIARLLLDGRGLLLASFAVLVVLELLVPVVAERRGSTPFHPHHISERYSLLTLIVLGEVILASVQAVQGALLDGGGPGLLALVVGGLLTVFSMWWLYFAHEHSGLFEGGLGRTFTAGYGHYLVFASVAATGAALAACVDVVQGESTASAFPVGLGIAAAVAVYLWSVTLMHAVAGAARSETAVGVSAGVALLAVALTGPSASTTVLTTGLVLAAVVGQHVWSSQRHSTGWSSPLSTS